MVGRVILPFALFIGFSYALGQEAGIPHVVQAARTLFDEGVGFEVRLGPNDQRSARPGGEPQFDAIRGMITNGPGKNHVGQVSALAGTIRGRVNNKLPDSNNGYSVGVFGNATCETDGCVSFGSNFVATDSGPDLSGLDIDRGAAHNRTIEGTEIDLTIAHSSTVGIGVNLVGNFQQENGKTSPTFAYDVSTVAPSQSPWAQGYSTSPGSAIAAFVAGPATWKGESIPSQSLQFNYFDKAGRQQSLRLRGEADGDVHIIDGGIVSSTYRERLTTPTSSSAPCIAGQFSDDKNYHYVCVEDNKWKRVALSSF